MSSQNKSTAYLLVILDETGAFKSAGLYSERHITMRFADTSACVMEYSASTYGEARKAIIDSLRSLGGRRDWLLRALGEEVS